MIFSVSPQKRALERMMTTVPRFRPEGGGLMVLHRFEYTSEIADLMDEAAIESLEDTTMDFDDMNQTTDNNIESLMNEVDTTPDIGAVTLDAKPEVANEGNASEIESLLNAEGVNPSDLCRADRCLQKCCP